MNSIEKFFKEELDGKYARIFSGGLEINGTLEQKCKMSYKPYFGVNCSVELEFNSSETINLIQKELRESFKGPGIAHDVLEKFIPNLKKVEITCGRVYLLGIVKINSSYNEKGELYSAILEYNDGTKISIKGISDKKIHVLKKRFSNMV